MSSPKLFISYSWSNPNHERWVLELAEQLVSSGVDVVLDKWDLKEGHDAVVFMEQMVNHPEIGKVAIVADQTYANRANERVGGVGTETQIISKEIYEQQKQDKFVVVVAEKDEDGKPYLPTYYKSRVYIDLSEPDNYAEGFEQLLRWIFDKPMYKKPKIGSPPSFLDDSTGSPLVPTLLEKRVLDGLRENKPYGPGALDEYLTALSWNFESLRLADVEEPFDNAVVDSINNFASTRNEFIRILFAVGKYMPTEENVTTMHRFFESLIPYMNWSPSGAGRANDFDNFRFIVHELFLYTLTVLIKCEQFGAVNSLLMNRYYVSRNAQYGLDTMVDFSVFAKKAGSLEERNRRLNLHRISLRADMLKEHSVGSGVEFRYLMQTDFILFMRSQIDHPDSYYKWYPYSLLYLGHFPGAFEIFARAESRIYFDKIKCLLNIQEPADLDPILELYRTGKRKTPRWGHYTFDPENLLAFDSLGQRP